MTTWWEEIYDAQYVWIDGKRHLAGDPTPYDGTDEPTRAELDADERGES